MTGIEILIEAFLYILPAYIANCSAVIFGGGKPLDNNKKYKGKRILGDGKTIKGTVFGITCGFLTGLVITLATRNTIFLGLGLLVSIGAISGDIIASFFKRRIGVNRGGPVPLLDQLDFVFGALILGSILKIPSLWAFLAIIIFTPSIHLTTNLIAYYIGLKKDPW